MTERTRSQIQAAEMSFLRRVAGHSPLEIGWGARSLGRSSEKSRWSSTQRGASWGVSGICSGCLLDALLGRCSGHVPPEGDPRGKPRTRWRDYVSRLAWEHLGLCLDFCPCDPAPDKRKRMSGRTDIAIFSFFCKTYCDFIIFFNRLLE